ncbi:hypothetical protein K493DRAFT_307154 [Basidiobolus meristosporus CBS 931.73]|uniref:TLC domain-containing protein n=1 Tax=Basidiobolus meristosporus CBS 931.73 TaxID=1314790 RepID=A0A1Y1XJV2_9FUNG|nr:hypothetical protein K493DRAFT_307154 [Basidiobolus meristosporus CBS 931.73]|eukprot:ORX86031.1 hypothetical protein K493DRAFT_307154 [Basidiobolus meristosporus CBS 931.73]
MSTLLIVGLSTAFYSLLHFASEKLIVPRFNQIAVSKLSKNDRIDLSEKFPSCVNSIVVGLFSFYLVFIARVFDNDIFTHYPPALDVLFAGLLGYTIYDSSVMFLKPKEEPTIWIHHLVVAFGCIMEMYYRQAAFFPTMFCVTEITVIPTNLVWYLQRLQMKNTKLYTKALIARAAAFLFIRLPIAPFVFWYALDNQGLPPIETLVSGTLATANNTMFPEPSAYFNEKISTLFMRFSDLPWIVSLSCTFNILALGLLNTVWTVVIVGHLYKHFSSKQHAKQM